MSHTRSSCFLVRSTRTGAEDGGGTRVARRGSPMSSHRDGDGEVAIVEAAARHVGKEAVNLD